MPIGKIDWEVGRHRRTKNEEVLAHSLAQGVRSVARLLLRNIYIHRMYLVSQVLIKRNRLGDAFPTS